MAYWQKHIRTVSVPIEDRMELRIIGETDKAYHVADLDDSNKHAWLPKSQVHLLSMSGECVGKDGTCTVYMPQWLGRKVREQMKGLSCKR